MNDELTKIKVVTDSPTDFSLLTQVERETLIRAMIAEYPDLPESLFNAFVSMELRAIHDRIASKCDTMIELILRQILETRMAIPVLPTLSMTSAQKRALAAANAAAVESAADFNADSATKSSPAGENSRVIAKAESLKGIVVRVTHPIPCLRGNIESIAAPNEDLPLIGIKVLTWAEKHSDIPDKPVYPRLVSTRAGIHTDIADVSSACALFQWISQHIASMQGARSIMPAVAESGRNDYKFAWTPPAETPELLRRLDCRDVRDVFIRNLDVIWFKMNFGDLSAIEPYEQMREFRAFMAKMTKTQNISAEIRSSLLNIIRGKLGIQTYDRVLRSYLPGDRILTLLDKKSAEIVRAEYDRARSRAKAIANNNCPHIDKLLQFERTESDYSFRRLSEFMPVMDLPATSSQTKSKGSRKNKVNLAQKSSDNSGNDNNTTNTAMIQCVRCGFDMICPHTVEMMEMRNYPQNDIATAMQKYIIGTQLKDNYYCKICGAAIFSTDMFSDLKQPVIMENEELKTMQWGEIASIIRYLKFSTVMNVSHFIALVRDSTYKYIAELEKQILKSKTTTADEIKAKKRLYATIYGYAYIVMIIMSGKYGVGFRDIAPKSNHLLEYLKHSIELIINTKNVIIKTISGFSNDLIKNQLISAYKAVTTGETILADTGVGELEPTRVSVRYDPVYWYIYDFTIRNELLNGSKSSQYYPGMISRMKEILHMDVDTIDSKGTAAARGKRGGGKPNSSGKNSSGKNHSDKDSAEITSVYERVKLPDLRSWQLNTFDKITGRLQSQSEWKAAMQGFIAASYRYFLQKLRVDDDNITTEFTKLLDRQYILDQWRQTYHFHGFSSIERKIVHRLPEYWVTTVDINRIFDESGRKHVWNILLVKGAENPAENKISKNNKRPVETDGVREMSLGEITSTIESGHRFEGKVVDRKCSVCGIRKSAVNDISAEKIKARLQEITSTQNFFRWFENRCPEGGHHIWADGKCTQCNIDLQMFTAQFGEAAQGYRMRYSEKFAMVSSSQLILPKEEPAPDDPFAEEYANYSFDFNTVLALASKLKINHKLIMALGAFEKTSIGDIEGTFIPPEITFRDHPRVYVLNAHIKNMFTWYNLFRGYARLIRPPAEITAVITELGLTYNTIGVMDKLPAIYNQYNSRLDHFYHAKKPRNIIEFQLQSLCEKLLLILDGPETKLRRAIVDFIVKKILHSETLLTRAGDFNWSIVYPDSKITTSDENYETEKEERVDDDDEDASPFSMNAFDIEDTDPDDEDVSNQVRVGENLGLD